MDKKFFYQWDLNRRLQLSGVDAGTEVHFCNPICKETECLTVYTYEKNGSVYADVPNVILQIPGTFKVYVWPFYTTKYRKITVIARPKPADYVYTEVEIYTIEQAVNKALEKAKESGELDGKTPTFKVEDNVLYVSYDNGQTWDLVGNVGGTGGGVSEEAVIEIIEKYLEEHPPRDGADGKDGENGADGYTPVRGTDYWTEADKESIVQDVINALPNGDEVSY